MQESTGTNVFLFYGSFNDAISKLNCTALNKDKCFAIKCIYCFTAKISYIISLYGHLVSQSTSFNGLPKP
jgi:hypothetical protein